MRHHVHNEDCEPTACEFCGCCTFCEGEGCGCSGTVQCGDVGVVVSGDAAVRDAVVARLPAHGLDASPVGRWERGLEALVSFVQEVVR